MKLFEILTDDDQLSMMTKLITSKGYKVRETTLRNKPALDVWGNLGTYGAKHCRVHLRKDGNWEAVLIGGQGHKLDNGTTGDEQKVLDYLEKHRRRVDEGKDDDAPMVWRTAGSLLRNGKELYAYVNLYDNNARRNKPTELLKVTAAIKKKEMYVFYVGDFKNWFELTEEDDATVTISKQKDGTFLLHFIKNPKTGFNV